MLLSMVVICFCENVGEDCRDVVIYLNCYIRLVLLLLRLVGKCCGLVL